MKLSSSLLIAAQLLSALALPAPKEAGQVTSVIATPTTAAEPVATTTAAAGGEAGAGEGEAGAGEGEAGAGEGEAGAGEGEAGAGEGEGEENEVEQEAEFGTVIELGGGDVKTDTLFPPGVS